MCPFYSPYYLWHHCWFSLFWLVLLIILIICFFNKILFFQWARLGVNIKNFPFNLSAIGFHGALASELFTLFYSFLPYFNYCTFFFRYIYSVWNVLGIPRYVQDIEIFICVGDFNILIWQQIAIIHRKKKIQVTKNICNQINLMMV